MNKSKAEARFEKAVHELSLNQAEELRLAELLKSEE
jgi:hypothetical protein